MIVAWINERRGPIAAIAAVLAAITVIALAGGLDDARVDVEKRRPGSKVELARWTVDLPAEASSWSGSPYSEYEGDAMVGALLRIETTDVESTWIDSRTYRAAVLTNTGAWRSIAEDAGSTWLHRDGEVLGELHPRLAEQVLLAWTLPKKLEPQDVRTLRLTLHDEYEHEGIQGTSWKLFDRQVRVDLPVTAGEAPVAPGGSDDA